MIVGSAQPLCQRKVQTSYAVAELKNDVIGSGFTEVLIRSDNEPANLAMMESAATALKLAGVNVKIEESALNDSQSQGLAESVVKDVKECHENEFGLSRQTLWTRVPRRTPSPDLACAVLRGVCEQVHKRSSWRNTACELRMGRKFARALPHLLRKSLHGPWSHERCGESRTKMGGWNLPWCV